MDRFQAQQHHVNQHQAQPAWCFKKVRGMMLGALVAILFLLQLAAFAGDSKSGASSGSTGSSSATSSASGGAALTAQPPLLKPTPFNLPQQAHPTIQKTLPIQNRATIQPRQ